MTVTFCEGVAKGFAKGSAKGLTCNAKGSKGFVGSNAYKQHLLSASPYGYRISQNPFDSFEALVSTFAKPFADPFATPSHMAGGPR